MGLASFEIKTRRSRQKVADTMNMNSGRRAQQSNIPQNMKRTTLQNPISLIAW